MTPNKYLKFSTLRQIMLLVFFISLANVTLAQNFVIKRMDPLTNPLVDSLVGQLVGAGVIVENIKSNLSENGFLFFEIHPDFSAEISDLLKLKGFINIELRKDLQGKNRMIKAQNP